MMNDTTFAKVKAMKYCQLNLILFPLQPYDVKL